MTLELQDELRWKRYRTYRDSGVEWIGEIPEGWDVERLGSIGRFSKGGGFSKADLVESGSPAILYGDIYSRYNVEIKAVDRFVTTEVASKAVRAKDGDILFAGSGETLEEIGKCVFLSSANKTVIGGDVIVFRQTKHNSKFLSYVQNSKRIAVEKAKGAKGEIVVHTYGSKLRALKTPLPPAIEQTAIADFLDEKTAKIDEAIRQKERMIELLKERKQILIQQAVTRGLDPDVPMKDSGIEWIGQIPAHWVVKYGNRVFEQRKELARKNDVQLSATQLYGVISQESYEEKIGRKVTKVTLHLEKRRHVEVDDFVISMRSFQGGLERAWEQGCIRSSYVVLKPTSPVVPRYFQYLFKCGRYIEALQSTANFIRDGQDLNFENFRRVVIPIPPITEQEEIGKFIDSAIRKMDEGAERFRSQITTLREYRATLIDSAVTGKIDVRPESR